MENIEMKDRNLNVSLLKILPKNKIHDMFSFVFCVILLIFFGFLSFRCLGEGYSCGKRCSCQYTI